MTKQKTTVVKGEVPVWQPGQPQPAPPTESQSKAYQEFAAMKAELIAVKAELTTVKMTVQEGFAEMLALIQAVRTDTRRLTSLSADNPGRPLWGDTRDEDNPGHPKETATDFCVDEAAASQEDEDDPGQPSDDDPYVVMYGPSVTGQGQEPLMLTENAPKRAGQKHFTLHGQPRTPVAEQHGQRRSTGVSRK